MIKVVKSGFYTSVQDLGRMEFRKYGVPISGAMDAYSSSFANLLVANTRDKSVIEMTMTGPSFVFTKSAVIGISGANMQPKINNEPVEHNKAIIIRSNDVLSFGVALKGFRCYLAVKGGFKIPIILQSCSMLKPITAQQQIKNNDLIDYDEFEVDTFKNENGLDFDNTIISSVTLEVYKGLAFNILSKNEQSILLKKHFSISKYHNRMAYQLQEVLPNHLPSVLTFPVLPGSVQLTPAGKLIILMRDCQTTGGYPVIFQLTEESINRLSQKSTADIIKFKLISI